MIIVSSVLCAERLFLDGAKLLLVIALSTFGAGRLLFGLARLLLIIALSTMSAERFALGKLSVRAEKVMVRFSDTAVSGFVSEKNISQLTPFS